MQTLDEIKARFPKNRHKDIDAAFILGLNELDAKLTASPRVARHSPAAMPPLQRSLLFHTLLVKCQSMQLPGHRYDVSRDAKYRLGQMQNQTDANLHYLLGLLPQHLRITDSQHELDNKAAALEYVDNFAAVLWEGMEALLSCDDPVKAVALLRLLQEEGMDAVQLAPDPAPEPVMEVAA